MPTRDHLLAAAERVIRREGLGGATTRAIATEAGCAEGTLYNHFEDKQDLIAEVMTTRLPAFIQYAVDLPGRAGTGSLRGNLTELAELAIAFFREIAPMVASTLGDPDLRARHLKSLAEHGRGPHRPILALAEYLQAEQRIGRVRKRIDTAAVATLFLGGCFQFAFLTLGLPPELLPVDEDQLIKGAIRALLVGLEPESKE